MNVNESAAASTKVVGAAAIISRALYRVLTKVCFYPAHLVHQIGHSGHRMAHAAYKVLHMESHHVHM